MDFEYLLFLQNLRAEAPNFINSLLLFISEFAAGSLPVVIIVVFYWCIDKRTGQRMGLCFAGATMVTQLIKNIACVYRPWKQDARLQIAPEAAATATGYSFPSGHATLAASFYGNIAAYLKKYSKWWILPCVLLTLLTAFARNWLGAHTPQDVLVGMMIALVVLLLSKHLLNWADGGKNRDWLLAIVGVILSALDLDPLGVIDLLLSFVQRLWDMGFAAIEQVGKYLVLGAVIVVPIWLVSRIFSARGR